MIDKSDKFRVQFLKWHSAEDFQQLGIAGLEVLGTNAAPAVAELTKLLNDKEHAFVAVRCLVAVGPPAEQSVSQALMRQPARSSRAAIVLAATAAGFRLRLGGGVALRLRSSRLAAH
jgi:hypothetical protein